MGSRYCKSFRKLELPVTPKMSLSFVPLAVSFRKLGYPVSFRKLAE